MTPPPDRRAATLAERQRLLATAREGPFDGLEGASDARVDLHLLWAEVDEALRTRGTADARTWIEGLDTPDLRAGTLQDGTARGLAARLEEALSLCGPRAEDEPDPEFDDEPAGKALRKIREFLIPSAGARVRFSRRDGFHLIDRDRGINERDCLRLEDQGDDGDLDRFVPRPGTRPRLFSPAFLRPERFRTGKRGAELVLHGVLGRGAGGYPCQLRIRGSAHRPGIHLECTVENRHRDHRLRIRFLGLQDGYVERQGTPAFRAVERDGRGFLAATLVRACGRLRVGDEFVATPAAQMQGVITHRFGLGTCG